MEIEFADFSERPIHCHGAGWFQGDDERQFDTISCRMSRENKLL